MANPLDHLYSSRRWRALRLQVLAREPLCRYCHALGRIEPATVCDHIEPHRGNVQAFWSGPFQGLCKRCHDSVKQAMERSGKARGCDADGYPLDAGHEWNTTAR